MGKEGATPLTYIIRMPSKSANHDSKNDSNMKTNMKIDQTFPNDFPTREIE
jgi:hypothetical protein